MTELSDSEWARRMAAEQLAQADACRVAEHRERHLANVARYDRFAVLSALPAPNPSPSATAPVVGEELKAWAAGEAEKQEAWALLDDKQALSSDAAETAASRRALAAHYRAVVAQCEALETLTRDHAETRKEFRNLVELHDELDKDNQRLTRERDAARVELEKLRHPKFNEHGTPICFD